MTQEQKDKLRMALYNAKFTTDEEDENQFVGVYFDDLLAIIEDYVEPPIYHEGWLAGEANLAKEYKNIQWFKWIPVDRKLPEENTTPLVRMDLSDKFGEETIIYDVVVFDGNGFHTPYKVTHWTEIQPPRKEE